MPKQTFLLKFFLLFLAFTFLFRVSFFEGLLVKSLGLTLAALTGLELSGKSIIVNGIELKLAAECTGSAMYSIFLAFALAWGGERRRELIGVLTGIILLFMLNLLRVLTLITSARISAAALDFTHDLLWPASFFVFVLLTAYLHTRWCKA